MTEKRLDVMFTKNARSIAARKRAARQLQENPDYFKKSGSIGGAATNPNKGFGSMDKARHLEISKQAGKIGGKTKREN